MIGVNFHKGPFIIYRREGAGDFLGGHFFGGSRRWGGHLFLARKNLKKPAKPIFQGVSGKNKTKKFFRKKFPGGALIFGGLEKKSPPPHK